MIGLLRITAQTVSQRVTLNLLGSDGVRTFMMRKCLRIFFQSGTITSSVLEDEVGLCCPDMRKGLELTALPVQARTLCPRLIHWCPH